MFGIDVRYRVDRSVELVCPRCGLDRAGSVLTPHRWWCIGRWPILPLGEHERVVMCDECGHVSDLGVLDVPTTAALAVLLEDAWVAAIVLVLRAEHGVVDPDARERAERTLAEAGYDAASITLDRALTALHPDDARRRLRRLAPEMTAIGKQGFLHRITAVARGDAEMTDALHQTILAIGVDLRMATPHVHGIVATALSDV